MVTRFFMFHLSNMFHFIRDWIKWNIITLVTICCKEFKTAAAAAAAPTNNPLDDRGGEPAW